MSPQSPIMPPDMPPRNPARIPPPCRIYFKQAGLGRLNVSDTNSPIGFCRGRVGLCPGLIGTGEPRLSFPAGAYRLIANCSMVIVQAILIGLIIVAASVAAQVIAEADYRLALPASSQRSRPSADLTSRATWRGGLRRISPSCRS